MISFKQYVNSLTSFQPINELQYLSDFINKKGNNFLDELLNRKVTVNLKIDQSAIVVKNDKGVIRYYGREGRVEITKFRRQGMDLYEAPINHFESRNLSKIPVGVSVYLEFFDDKLPTLVRYTTKPKNNMIISYIVKNGTVLLPSDPLNIEMAKLLDVTPPPVLFDGKLSKSQKEQLIEYVSTPHDKLNKKYGGKNFVQFVLSLFVPPDQMKFLMTNMLEGLVFYFDDGKTVDMAKINDPTFTENLKVKSKKEDKYNSELMKIVYDNLETNAESVLNKPYNGYQNFVEKLTQTYLKNNKSDLKKLNVYQDSVSEQRFASLGFTHLPASVSKMVEKSWVAEDLYRIFHFMFENPKKRVNAKTGLTKERKDLINSIFVRIQK